MPDSSGAPGLWPARPLCPWDSPGKNTGVGCHFLLQGIFPTQESNPCHLLADGFFTTEPPGKPIKNQLYFNFQKQTAPNHHTHTRVHGTYVYTDPPVTGRELLAGLRVTTSKSQAGMCPQGLRWTPTVNETLPRSFCLHLPPFL